MEMMANKDSGAPREIPPASSTVNGKPAIPPASSTVNAADRVAVIARRRIAAGWSHAKLLRLARVDKQTWQDLRAGRREAQEFTLTRLERALDGVIETKPPQIVRAYHRIVMRDLCRHLRVPASAIDQDMSVQRPRNRAWLQAARINRMAIYIIAVELELKNAELGRAIGCSRQNVQQARNDVEDWRETDRKIDRAIAKVTALVRRGLT